MQKDESYETPTSDGRPASRSNYCGCPFRFKSTDLFGPYKVSDDIKKTTTIKVMRRSAVPVPRSASSKTPEVPEGSGLTTTPWRDVRRLVVLLPVKDQEVVTKFAEG